MLVQVENQVKRAIGRGSRPRRRVCHQLDQYDLILRASVPWLPPASHC